MSTSAWGNTETEYFFSLTPEKVLDAVEASGTRLTGRCFQLNSFENRVYDLELELDERPTNRSEGQRIAKFYRPGRWSEKQILEEHEFLLDLIDAEIPAIAPLKFSDGTTLKKSSGGIWYALFPKVGGRAPDELNEEQCHQVGRLLARIHAVGLKKPALNRIVLNPQTYGRANLAFLLPLIPKEFRSRYEAAVLEICERGEKGFAGIKTHRLHGDCHLGNLLWNNQGAFFLDFDDMVVGPAVQDLWLLIPGRDEVAKERLNWILDGYDEMGSFDYSSLKLIEILRALRFIHYTAWIARRWADPSFPKAFPQFGTEQYWNEMTGDLEEQLEIIKGLS